MEINLSDYNTIEIRKDRITFFVNGRHRVIKVGDPRWDKAVEIAANHAYDKVDELFGTSAAAYVISEAYKVMSSSSVGDIRFDFISDKSDDSVCWEGEHVRVLYKEQPLPSIIQTRMVEMLKKGMVSSIPQWSKFLDNVMANPIKECRDEVYRFLENRDLPIVYQRGTFLAYKGVTDTYWSCHGNTSTRVLSGTCDSEGHILNVPGSTIKVVREDVNKDPNQHCSWGLHVGAYSYANGFGSRTMLVEVNPRDVVAVPRDNCEKCRVSEYTVIGEYHGEAKINGTAVNITGSTVSQVAEVTAPSVVLWRRISDNALSLQKWAREYVERHAIQTAYLDNDKLEEYSDGWCPEDIVSEVGLSAEDDSDSILPNTVSTCCCVEHPNLEDWWVVAREDYDPGRPDDIDVDELVGSSQFCHCFTNKASVVDSAMRQAFSSELLRRDAFSDINEEASSVCSDKGMLNDILVRLLLMCPDIEVTNAFNNEGDSIYIARILA